MLPTPSLPRQLASLARFAAQRTRREREDAQALTELSGVALGLPRGLDVEWLGTAGYRLSLAGQILYVDPYVSRVSVGDVVRRRVAVADPEQQRRWLSAPGEVVGVLVGHTHFDHAIDVPELCRRTGARAYGSSSLCRLMRVFGLADSSVEVVPRQDYELGPFRVRFVPSLHSKLVLGLKVPFDGEVTCDHADGFNAGAYRCGSTYGIQIDVAGVSLYHQGSANLIDDEVPTGGVDVFLAGIAGRSFTPRYWDRILPRLRPNVVVASHFDDFLRPLESGLGFSTNVNLAAWPDEIAAVSRDVVVAALPPPQLTNPKP